MSTSQQITNALEWRYATKIFDPKKGVTKEELDLILESGRLAPSSIGTEPWKFIVVENPELRTKMRAASWDQPKLTDAAYVIVIARRTDVREHIAEEALARTARIQSVDESTLGGLKQMLDGGVSMRDDAALDAWASAQTYIPLGMMMLSAALLEVDTCPMEGFDRKAIDEILGLSEQNLTASTILTVGHRGEDPAANRPKVRRTMEEVVAYVK